MSNSIQVRSAKIVKAPPSSDCDVVVLGAGPYGLSAGVYLKAKEIDVRVFGEPVDFWANQMPKGMLLRSPREASGPLLYFVAGTDFASKELASYISKHKAERLATI
jgi:cation diffusion facilitator CzcD-associated flavoprotein CzcO